MYNADANQNVFGGKSLEFQGNENDDSFKTVRLRDRLNEADTERRKEQDAAAARERAAEIAREERIAKIAYMNEMPEDTPAGTGKFLQCFEHDFNEFAVETVAHFVVLFLIFS